MRKRVSIGWSNRGAYNLLNYYRLFSLDDVQSHKILTMTNVKRCGKTIKSGTWPDTNLYLILMRT